MAALGLNRVRRIQCRLFRMGSVQPRAATEVLIVKTSFTLLLSTHPLHFLSSSRGCGNGGKTVVCFSTVSIALRSMALLNGQEYQSAPASAQVDFTDGQMPEGH